MKKFSIIICAVTALFVLFASTVSATETDAGSAGETAEPEITVTPALDYFGGDFRISDYVSLGSYRGLTLTCNVWPCDSELEALYRQMTRLAGYYDEIKDRTTAGGDRLNIDYTGTCNGVTVDEKKDANIELSNSTGFVSGFDVGLYGVMPGTTVRNTVEYAADYSDKNLAGKTVSYLIRINYIYGFRLTDNDVFVYTEGKCATVEAYRNFLGEYLAQYNLTYYDDLLSGVISDELLYRSVFKEKKLPEAQIEFYMTWAKKNDKNAASLSQPELRAYAELLIQEDLVLAAVCEAEGVRFTGDFYNAEATKKAAESGLTQQQLETLYGGADYCRIALMKSYASKIVLNSATVITDKDKYLYLIETENTATETRPIVSGNQTKPSAVDPNLVIILTVIAVGALAGGAVAAVFLIKKKKH